MPTTNETVNEVTGELLLGWSQRDLVGFVAEYARARADEQKATQVKTSLGAAIKNYLEQNPNETLYDGESGYEARLQRRSGRDTYDTRSMPEALILRLHAVGALDLNPEVVKSFAGRDVLSLELDRYRVPAGEQAALIVRQRTTDF